MVQDMTNQPSKDKSISDRLRTEAPRCYLSDCGTCATCVGAAEIDRLDNICYGADEPKRKVYRIAEWSGGFAKLPAETLQQHSVMPPDDKAAVQEAVREGRITFPVTISNDAPALGAVQVADPKKSVNVGAIPSGAAYCTIKNWCVREDGHDGHCMDGRP
jgi:hypothetical protein